MRILLSLLLILVFSVAGAQSLLDSVGNPGFNLQDTLSEKLADLAISNRNVIVEQRDLDVKKYEMKKNRAAWLNNIGANFNLNEANIKSSNTNANLFFPRYNLSMNLPLGYFFTKSRDVQISKANIELKKAEMDVKVYEIRQAIKLQYQAYRANMYLLALHEAILQDELVIWKKTEAKFAKNEVTLETLSSASKSYQAELVKKINLLKDLNTSKYMLESLLGMTLEEALAKINPPAAVTPSTNQ
jgi:outer membrane protein TolC